MIKDLKLTYYSISIEMSLAREIIQDLAVAFLDRHLDWHNLTQEGDDYVTWGIPLNQHNWQQRLANALAECNLIDEYGILSKE